MSDSPPTRPTLLVQVRDVENHAAWEQFVEIYAPLVYRYARRQGLQDADAADLTQDVLQAVARSMPSFEYDPRQGRFRTWLFTIAGNKLRSRWASGQRRMQGSGDTAVHEWLADQPDPGESDEEFWNREHERRLFEWAAERVQGCFQEATWQAFRQTAVEGRSPQEVADSLGLSVGAVYIAKSRVLARLKEEIERILGECA